MWHLSKNNERTNARMNERTKSASLPRWGAQAWTEEHNHHQVSQWLLLIWDIKLSYRMPDDASGPGDAFLNPNFFSHLLLPPSPRPAKNPGFLGKWLNSTYYKTFLLRWILQNGETYWSTSQCGPKERDGSMWINESYLAKKETKNVFRICWK